MGSGSGCEDFSFTLNQLVVQPRPVRATRTGAQGRSVAALAVHRVGQRQAVAQAVQAGQKLPRHRGR